MRYLINVDEGDRLDGDNFVISGLNELGPILVNLGFEVSVNLFDRSFDGLLEELKKIVKQATVRPVFFPRYKARKFNDTIRAFEDRSTALNEKGKILVTFSAERSSGL